MVSNDKIRVDFVCVYNAGRSQMAAAFAEHERSERDLEDAIEVYSGGTEPADTVQAEVVEALAEVGLDIADRNPSWVADLDNLEDSDYLITMGCSITKFNPARYGVESHEWDLTNPDGQDMETVREVRDEIERRVTALFDEIEQVLEEKQEDANSSKGFVTSVRDSLSL